MAMDLTEEEWKQKLTPEQYHVLREQGTEAPFSGQYLKHNADGLYTCMACGAKLFTSDTKYESNQAGLEGWPSFADPAGNEAVELREDNSLGMHRTEVICKNCGSHLGHVFEDASSPTGQHFCINSTCLAFDPKQAQAE